MSPRDSEASILLADIIGSTTLYEAVGDDEALRQIADAIDRLRAIAERQGGMFLRAKGDDLLCAFGDPSAALRAVRQMLSARPSGALRVHAGIHFGRIIHERGDIFGDAVNIAARLAALAKSGEVLVSRRFLDQLPEADSRSLRLLDDITFKGKNAATEVYSLVEDDAMPRTAAGFGGGSGHPAGRHRPSVPEASVTLRHGALSRSCEAGASFSIGRSPECDLVIGRPWVSRRHATVTVRHGKVQFEDSSTTGTYVATRDGDEFLVRRETLLLTGAGIISPAMRPNDERAEVIHFAVERRRADRGP